MSHNSPSPQSFEILCDSRSGEDDQSSQNHQESNPAQSQPLCHLSISQSQNRQLEQVPVGNDNDTHQLNQVLSKPHWVAIQKNSNKKEKCIGGRLTRPSLASNTFEVLSTVSESESETQSATTASKVSDDAQQILQPPVEQYSSQPLSIAARHIPPLKEQLVKHRDGLFEWILAVRVPIDSKSHRDISSGTDDQKQVRKVYFGCNLLPKTSSEENEALKTTCPVESHLLLVTPLKESKEVLEVFREPIGDSIMAFPDANSSYGTPAKASNFGSVHGSEQMTPASTVCTRGDDSVVESIISTGHGTAKTSNHDSVHGARQVTPASTVRTRGDDSVVESITSRSPADPVARIEDSFEALDRLEEQLEAFDKVAHFDQYISAEKPPSTKEPVVKIEIATTSSSVRFATPQPNRTFAKPGSGSLRVKPASEPRKPALRKVTSMILDSPKLKTEDKALMQASTKPPTIRRAIDVSSQKLVGKSPKQPTIPKFELPGEAVARQLKEKKETRLATQRATQPTAASLRRSKSLKLLTRPTFELPGEAISRRKREEHQAQLRAQEEEERRRREFKARPIPTKVVSTTVPRGTIASRARQTKAALAENSGQTSTPNKRPATTMGSHSRSVLSSTINRPQSRGRGVRGEGSSIYASRATSTSTGSVSGTRSAVSVEDVQMQKLRGHEIYQRDNSWTDSRVREKCEREALAKLAREEAAEKSRQQSREWAAKQAKKRMTINSLRDVMA
ncbi:hypothetical protein HD806DRAFT_349183 [Xylariaceae sp. AK1471]|nr:hypothetical protein HD806DRAFT_349183 [Xylariaceae sp. AK1471]